MNKIENFKQLREYLCEIPFINSGGCAIAAVTMHRWLKQNGEKSSIIFFYHEDDEDYYNNRDILKRRSNAKPESCGHAMIKYKNRFRDCSAKLIHCYLKKHHVVSEKFAVDAINKGSWNSRFQRKFFVKEIQENTGVDLSDIKIK